MKLLFLDIDGVMTNDDTIINPSQLISFSPSCVDVLNQILRTHDLKIILTSSWLKENPPPSSSSTTWRSPASPTTSSSSTPPPD